MNNEIKLLIISLRMMVESGEAGLYALTTAVSVAADKLEELLYKLEDANKRITKLEEGIKE